MKRLLLAAIVISALSVNARSNETELPEWDGSRSTPVHRLPLYDETAQQIAPSYDRSLPFSVKFTCGPCHPYDTVSQGLHFNSTTSGNPGRPGEPWVWVDPSTGTQIPLSYRDWPGVYHPSEIGMSEWKFVQTFGRHLPGGDMAESGTVTPDSRWNVSGKVEINCLGCHNADLREDMSEWAKQMERENFRWAATAAAGLGQVGGMASRLRDSWNVFDGANPDDTEWAVPPSVDYYENEFDHKQRHVFEVVHQPKDNRCYFCHSVRDIEVDRWESQVDVHSNAGLACADCHRNGLDHKMVRGYEGEAAERSEPAVAEFTCEGCHMAEADAAHVSGRLGAPHPLHKGLPPVHFERMTCTACHSGPAATPGEVRTVRTSRINRLGIHGRARWFTDLPQIAEPVLARDENGKLSPHRVLWPAFWAKVVNNEIVPLQPDAVAEAIPDILNAESHAGALLAALDLTPDATGDAVLVADGRIFRRNVSGEVDSEPYNGPLEGPIWARDMDGVVEPQVPAELAIDEEGYVDYDQEARILATFEVLDRGAFGKGIPVYVNNGAVFKLDEDGYFLESDIKAGEGFANGLAWYDGNKVLPLLDPLLLDTILKTDGRKETLTEEQIGAALRTLTEMNFAGESEIVYLAAGRLYRLEEDILTSKEDPAAAPVLWPMAHDVRPAAQALGAGGCTDCHTADSPYLFGTLTATAPVMAREPVKVSYASLMDIDEGFQRLFGSSFRMRSTFKVAVAAGSGVVGGFVLLYLLAALSRISGAFNLKLVVVAVAACVLILALTGFGAWWTGSSPITGLSLLLHVTIGGAFILVLPFLALSAYGRMRAPGETRANETKLVAPLVSRIGLWLLLTAGLLTALTILFSMVPVFGTHGLDALLNIHRWSGVLACVGLIGLLLGRRR